MACTGLISASPAIRRGRRHLTPGFRVHLPRFPVKGTRGHLWKRFRTRHTLLCPRVHPGDPAQGRFLPRLFCRVHLYREVAIPSLADRYLASRVLGGGTSRCQAFPALSCGSGHMTGASRLRYGVPCPCHCAGPPRWKRLSCAPCSGMPDAWEPAQELLRCRPGCGTLTRPYPERSLPSAMLQDRGAVPVR